MRRSITIASFFFAACAGAPPKVPETGSSTSQETPPAGAKSAATAGVRDPALRAMLERHWEETLRRAPIWATRLGDHRYDDQVGDSSLAAIEEGKKLRRAFLAEAIGIRDKGGLEKQDSITVRLFIDSLQADIKSEVCVFEEWTFGPRSNPLADWNDLSDLHQVDTPEDAKNLIARYRKAPAAIDQEIDNLRRGAAKQIFGNKESTSRTIAMFEAQLAQPIEKWPMLAPLAKERAGWSAADREMFSRELTDAVKTGVKPALERYLAFIKGDVLPKARGDDKPGLSALPFAKPCYQSQIESFTTIETTAQALHQKGREEIERINSEMQTLGKKLFGTDDLAKILSKLRSDPKLYFTNEKEVEDKAKAALAAARAKIPDYFGILPKADCVVSRIPDYEAPYTTIAYYRQPVPNGSKPGQYFINVYQPKTRPRYEAEALAFHEAIPGHHLQIAIAQELPDIPAFRRHMGMTVFVEGWALYTEQLANEMGLYSGDLDRMGMLSYESWRAARLVVDTGLHAMGWSREAAKGYMLGHTALAANNIDNEVDRYIVWPGQAVAYKTGQLEIWRLRRMAEAALGDEFDIKAFHDVVLRNGAVTLSVLGAEVEAWIASRRGG